MLRQLKRNLNIAFFKRGEGACPYYRLSLPLLYLNEKGGIEVKAIETGDDGEKIDRAVESSDVVVMQLAGAIQDGRGCVEECEVIKDTFKKKLVIDYDDNVFAVHPLSPIYSEWGCEEVEWDGKPLWVDGQNGLDLERNMKRRESMKQCMAMADMVTTTTEVAAQLFRQYSSNVAVLPNCIDPHIWQTPQFVKDETIRLYWSGGDGHYQDMYIIKDALEIIMEKYPQTKLVLYGARYEGLLKNLPKHRIEHYRWSDFSAYPYITILKNADISLIPLVDNEFNRCKSALKWIEQSTLYIPSVMSNVSPYKEVYEKDNSVMVDNCTASWVKGISILIDDRKLAKHIGTTARKTIEEKYDINTQWPKWEQAYRSLLT